jgi:hypothetical protein
MHLHSQQIETEATLRYLRHRIDDARLMLQLGTMLLSGTDVEGQPWNEADVALFREVLPLAQIDLRRLRAAQRIQLRYERAIKRDIRLLMSMDQTKRTRRMRGDSVRRRGARSVSRRSSRR